MSIVIVLYTVVRKSAYARMQIPIKYATCFRILFIAKSACLLQMLFNSCAIEIKSDTQAVQPAFT